MKLEEKVNQLTELLADLIPTVDRLAQVADRNQKSQEKSTLEFQEMRLSNMKLAEAIDALSSKIDRLTDLERRLEKIERIVLK